MTLPEFNTTVIGTAGAVGTFLGVWVARKLRAILAEIQATNSEIERVRAELAASQQALVQFLAHNQPERLSDAAAAAAERDNGEVES